MVYIRRFEDQDAGEVAQLVENTMLESNSKDYSRAYLLDELSHLTAADFIERAKNFHCYVFIDNETKTIIAVGSIGPYWGSETESSLFNIFVHPNYQGKGIGKQIIKTLEDDPYFKRANRIEIPASITALRFYQKMGYKFKNGHDKVDEEGLYRLEKVRSIDEVSCPK